MQETGSPLLPPATGVRRIARRMLRLARANTDGALLLAHGRDEHGRSTVVIGDSHSVCLVAGQLPSPRVQRADRSTTVLYLGPRLLHSVAREGFPDWVGRLIAARRRSPLARGGLTAVLTLGEIDLRCHLAKPGRGDADALASLAQAFVGQTVALLAALGPDGRVVVLSPNPPSEAYESEEGFPVVGGVDERVTILDGLCRAFQTEVAAVGDPALRFLDARSAVQDDAGQLRADLTFDGCHLNTGGAAIVRRMLADLDAH